MDRPLWLDLADRQAGVVGAGAPHCPARYPPLHSSARPAMRSSPESSHRRCVLSDLEDQRVWTAVLPAVLMTGRWPVVPRRVGVRGLRNWHREDVTVLVDDELSFEAVRGVRFFRTRRPLRPTTSDRFSELPSCRLEPAALLFAAYEPSPRTAQGLLSALVQQRLTTAGRLLAEIENDAAAAPREGVPVVARQHRRRGHVARGGQPGPGVPALQTCRCPVGRCAAATPPVARGTPMPSGYCWTARSWFSRSTGLSTWMSRAGRTSRPAASSVGRAGSSSGARLASYATPPRSSSTTSSRSVFGGRVPEAVARRPQVWGSRTRRPGGTARTGAGRPGAAFGDRGAPRCAGRSRP